MNLNSACSLMLSAAAALLIAACAASDPYKSPGPGQPDPLAPAAYPKVAVEDPLQPWVGVSEPIIKWEPLQVNVPVRALHEQGYDVRIEYRYVFFDGEGVPLRLQQSWRYEVLPGARTQISLAGTAMDDTARDWRLEIRRAR